MGRPPFSRAEMVTPSKILLVLAQLLSRETGLNLDVFLHPRNGTFWLRVQKGVFRGPRHASRRSEEVSNQASLTFEPPRTV
ncbi:MAG TPA: hypothetical protein VNA15_06830, partial [Candidatus Angelobacter sp.]|nr:hypothetical protein [Candidatus Angelobacter sp.]